MSNLLQQLPHTINLLEQKCMHEQAVAALSRGHDSKGEITTYQSDVCKISYLKLSKLLFLA